MSGAGSRDCFAGMVLSGGRKILSVENDRKGGRELLLFLTVSKKKWKINNMQQEYCLSGFCHIIKSIGR